jgi:hypothetical protein
MENSSKVAEQEKCISEGKMMHSVCRLYLVHGQTNPKSDLAHWQKSWLMGEQV